MSEQSKRIRANPVVPFPLYPVQQLGIGLPHNGMPKKYTLLHRRHKPKKKERRKIYIHTGRNCDSLSQGANRGTDTKEISVQSYNVQRLVPS
ncbi:hypothetical protein CARUB_v10021212mg [Capsella rubella]|uniref:Uncharacterized protein n=1 Tax=Capsella rubella TaxID=81985 RepID=R0GJL5_9BRAS|nr:hypothetical protein CARUB_v10021212mg [Capsella rubella]